MTLPIEVSDLRVTYGDVEALRDVSLRFEAGAICGVLGRNGAGKTTFALDARGVSALDQRDRAHRRRGSLRRMLG